MLKADKGLACHASCCLQVLVLISLLARDSTQRAHLVAAGVTPLVAAAALCPEAGQTQLQQYIKVG